MIGDEPARVIEHLSVYALIVARDRGTLERTVACSSEARLAQPGHRRWYVPCTKRHYWPHRPRAVTHAMCLRRLMPREAAAWQRLAA